MITASKRAELLRKDRIARLTIRMYMASFMHDAIEDAIRHPTGVDPDLWSRFMGWLPGTSGAPTDKSAVERADRRFNNAVPDRFEKRPSRSSAM
jgi:hypothetical protein